MNSAIRLRITVAAAILAALAGIALTSVSSARERWSEMQAWMERTQRAWDATDFERPALSGDTHPGLASAHYDRAKEIAAELLARDGENDALIAARLGQDSPTSDDGHSLRARWAPAVDAMRAGAHAADARSAIRFEDAAPDRITTNLLATRHTVNMACVAATDLLAEDRATDAVAITLDAAAFGADHVQAPLVIDQIIGAALIAIATTEYWTDERLELLDAPALELLAEGLRRLDQQLPVAMSLRGEALWSAHMLTNTACPHELEISIAGAWRFGFSTRWMTADAIVEIADSLDQLDTSADQSWPARERALDAAQEELSASANSFVQVGWPQLMVAERSTRMVVAQVRILRIAVDAQRGLTPAVLDDPLGDGPLEVVVEDGRMRITSDGSMTRRRLEREVALPSPR